MKSSAVKRTVLLFISKTNKRLRHSVFKMKCVSNKSEGGLLVSLLLIFHCLLFHSVLRNEHLKHAGVSESEESGIYLIGGYQQASFPLKYIISYIC